MTVDITLFGATGFTGGLTAHYLSRHLPDGASWAIAGRSRAKLEALADDIASSGGVAPEIVMADVQAQSSLTLMAENTRVLISTVGPYLVHGHAAVNAAVDAGIGYVDLTGEPQFVDEVWLAQHERAQNSGAVLVHACGFDSLPYDMGALYVMDQLPDDVPIQLTGYVRAKGGVSGGTFHSAVNQIGQGRDSLKIAKQRRARERRPDGRRVRGGGSLGRAGHGLEGWKVPLPLLDPQIVLRSARALPQYGPEFSYHHYAHVKTTAMLAAGAVGVGAVGLGAQFAPTRKLMLKAIDPGDGPSEEFRESSWFRLDLFAEIDGQVALHGVVKGSDPGYGGTSQMLSQAALCLAFDDVATRVPGQTTSAVALGQPLIERLNPQVLVFSTP